jgi:ATP-binding cassette subfamily F protein uup
MAAPPLLILQDIRLGFGTTRLLDGASLSVAPGERLALVGRNGSGKSTLLKIAAGLIEAEGGTRFLQPGATLRVLDQEPDLSGFADVLSYVEAGLGPADDAYRARYLLESLGMSGAESPAALSGGEAQAIDPAADRNRQDRTGRRKQSGYFVAGRQARHPTA